VVGDAPLAYVEGAGGVRVSEDDIVAVGKNDVRHASTHPFVARTYPLTIIMTKILSFKVGRA